MRPNVDLAERERIFREVYRPLGLRAIPLIPHGKRPLTHGWQKEETRAWPLNANVGLATGEPPQHLVVLDFDEPGRVHEVLGLRPRELCNRTLVARTARGYHVYARQEGAPSSRPLPGVDFRGAGGLVAAPPSVHPTGRVYAFLREDAGLAHLATLAPLPLLERVAPAAFPPTTETRAGRGSTPDRLGAGAPSVDEAAAAAALRAVNLARVEAWVRAQAPALVAHWEALHTEGASLDRSKADWVISLCLTEVGYAPEEVAWVLMQLPGSKARKRGAKYALHTTRRAAGTK